MKRKMTSAEIDQMFQLVKQYAENELDQFDLWKFNSNFGKVYIEISRGVPKSEENEYIDISHLIKNKK